MTDARDERTRVGARRRAASNARGELRIGVHTLRAARAILDAGVDARGGLDAGRALAELCMGGLGHVDVRADHDRRASRGPACRCGPTIRPSPAWPRSTPAGRSTRKGSSRWDPVRCARRRASSGSCSRSWATARTPHAACSCSRGGRCPTEDVAAWVAAKAGVEPEGITFAVAPTASVAGGVQIVARVLETGLHKMDALGFDVTRVRSAIGTAPIPPVAKNDLRAVGRTNDCILYGGQARYRRRRRRRGAGGAGGAPAGVRRPRITARRSTTSSNATTTTSIRSTRCCSVPARCG